MNRNVLLVSGAVCWSLVAIDTAAHLIIGDVLAPALMLAVLVLWVGLRVSLPRVRRSVPAA